MKDFTYAELEKSLADSGEPWIRLLCLHPGADSEPLQLTLRSQSLQSHDPYSAISYCWGGQEPSIPVTCDSCRLLITENLANCLAEIRRTRCVRQAVCLWADAICINQLDTKEKSYQVNLMKEIYVHAESTHIWLGSDMKVEEIDQALELLTALSSSQQRQAAAGDDRNVEELVFAGETHLYSLPNHEDPRWNLVDQLISHPWFSRVWIIQEAVVSKKAELVFPSRRYPMQQFCDALKYGAEPGVSIVFKAAVNLRNIWDFSELRERFYTGTLNHEHLFSLLLKFRRSSATDPRDKVFSLLQLLPSDYQPESGPIKADYSLSLRDVYVQAAEFILDQSRGLDLLSAPKTKPGVDEAKRLNLPSWVPNWSDPSHIFATPMTINTIHSDTQPDYNACNSCARSIALSSGQLELRGIIISRVHQRGLEMNPEVHFPNGLPGAFSLHMSLVFTNWESVCQIASKRTYMTGEDIKTAYLWTILHWMFCVDDLEEWRFDAWTEVYVAKRYYASPRHILDFLLRHGYTSLFRLLNFFPWRQSTRKMWDVQHLASTLAAMPLKETVVGRRFMVSDDGHIGLGPALVEEGDYICILQGASIPLVIRQKGSNWELIGDCYVHGIMNGEAFQNDRCSSIVLE